MRFANGLIRLAVLAVLPLVAVPAVAPAEPEWFDPDQPLVASDLLPAMGAVSYRFTVPEGADIVLAVSGAWENATMSVESIWLFNAAGELVDSGGGATYGHGGDTYAHVELPAPVGVLLHENGASRYPLGGGAGSHTYDLPAGEYVAVLASGSDGTPDDYPGDADIPPIRGEAALYGPEGTSLVSKSVSLGGFFHREGDFRGGNIQAEVIDGGTALVAASVAESVDHLLFGWFTNFQSPLFGLSILTAETPLGSSTNTDHWFDGTPAGDYVFRVEASVTEGNGLVAWGVDVVLPPGG